MPIDIRRFFCHFHFSLNYKIDKTDEKIDIFTYFYVITSKN